MAFRSIRDHQDMRFADSYTQDMDFWRQRVDKEETRRVAAPSPFTSDALADLPRNPFKDSAGMLFGKGVSERREETPLGVLVPGLAAYRAAVTPTMRTARPNAWHLMYQAPYHLAPTESFSPEARAVRGAMRLAAPEPSTYRPPPQFEKVRCILLNHPCVIHLAFLLLPSPSVAQTAAHMLPPPANLPDRSTFSSRRPTGASAPRSDAACRARASTRVCMLLRPAD